MRPVPMVLIVDALSHVKPEKLYEEPFNSLHDQGVEGLFDEGETDKIIATIRVVNLNARAA